MARFSHRFSAAVAVAVIGALAAGGLAFAAEDAVGDRSAAEAPSSPIETAFDPDAGVLVYWFPGDADAQAPSCAELLAEIETTAPDTDERADLPVLPDPCHVVDVTGPAGQVNHGTVVSAFVRSLGDVAFDGPKGRLVREIARSDAGKAVDGDDGGDAFDDAEAPEVDTDDVTGGPPAHARARARSSAPGKGHARNDR